MTDQVQTGSLLLVVAAAFAVPILFALIPRSPVPAIVGEVAAGIVLGGSVLGWVTIGPWLDFLSLFGLAYLLFLAGFEIDFGLLLGGRDAPRRLLHSPVALAAAGMAIRLALALAVALGLAAAGLVSSPGLVALLLASTSLGVVLSVLTERRLIRGAYGQQLVVAAAVADFTTVVGLTVFFSAEHRSAGAQVALVAIVLVVGAVLVAGLRRLSATRRVEALVDRLSGATSQIRVRGSLLLLLAFVALAQRLGLEVILGAFVAGAVASFLAPRAEVFRVKLEAVGYGFFVPVFFIAVGARLDIPGLLASGQAIIVVPLLVVAIFAVKTVPALVYRVRYGARDCLAAGALLSAQLTLTVAGVEIGRRLGAIDAAHGAALVLAALVSVLIAPVAFVRLHGRGGEGSPAAARGGEAPVRA